MNDPLLLADVLRYLVAHRDVVVRSHTIPGTWIVDDHDARNEIAHLNRLIFRLELQANAR